MKVRLPIFSGNLTFINRSKYLYTKHFLKNPQVQVVQTKNP